MTIQYEHGDAAQEARRNLDQATASGIIPPSRRLALVELWYPSYAGLRDALNVALQYRATKQTWEGEVARYTRRYDADVAAYAQSASLSLQWSIEMEAGNVAMAQAQLAATEGDCARADAAYIAAYVAERERESQAVWYAESKQGSSQAGRG